MLLLNISSNVTAIAMQLVSDSDAPEGLPCSQDHVIIFGESDNCSSLPSGDMYYIVYYGKIIPLRSLFLGVLLCLFSLITIAGNFLVVYSVYSRRYLRSSTNYLIVSLAASDLVVGLLVMPIGMFYETTNHVWLFGDVICDLWHSLDVLACSASIWNLCVISVDRYRALKNPLTYNRERSGVRIGASIASVWMCSILLSFPAIAWWRSESPELYSDDWSCNFVDDLSYLIFSSLVSFYVPTIIMMVAYWRIYLIARNHEESFKTGRKRTSGILKIGVDPKSTLMNRGSFQLRIHRGKNKMTTLYNSTESNLSLHKMPYTPVPRPRTVSTITSASLPHTPPVPPGNRRPVMARSSSDDQTSQTSACLTKALSEPSCQRLHLLHCKLAKRTTTALSESSVGKKISKFSKEKKASKTLGIVIGCYIMCWLPFFFVNVLLGVCKDCVADAQLLFTAVTWLGYCNSMLNPFIYSFFNGEFRRAFLSILCCGYMRRKMQRRVQHLRQQSQWTSNGGGAYSKHGSFSDSDQSRELGDLGGPSRKGS